MRWNGKTYGNEGILVEAPKRWPIGGGKQCPHCNTYYHHHLSDSHEIPPNDRKHINPVCIASMPPRAALKTAGGLCYLCLCLCLWRIWCRCRLARCYDGSLIFGNQFVGVIEILDVILLIVSRSIAPPLYQVLCGKTAILLDHPLNQQSLDMIRVY